MSKRPETPIAELVTAVTRIVRNAKHSCRRGHSGGLVRARAILVALALVVSLLAIVSAPPTANAQSVLPLTTTFKDASAPSWMLGGTAILTGEKLDAAGDGWLRLTDNTTYQAGYAYYDTPIPTASGMVVTFDYGAWGGSGADGLSFFLFDGATETFTPGASGGSLGYAQGITVTGLSNGYLGLGLDEFGFYSAATEGRKGGPGPVSEAVVVRGPGNLQSGYTHLAGVSTLTAGLPKLDCPANGATCGNGRMRPADKDYYRQVQITFAPVGKEYQVSIAMKFKKSDTAWTPLFGPFAMPTPPPATLKMGFAASTGGRTNYHEIRNVTVMPQTPALTGAPIGLVVESQSVLLQQGQTPTVDVPVRIDGDGQPLSSAAFSLDFDSSCLQYKSASIADLPKDFEYSVAYDEQDTAGELDFALWDQDAPLTTLTAPTRVAIVTFNILPQCQNDGATPVNFSSSPAPSLGGTDGSPIAAKPVDGTVTIDWNYPATGITLTPNTVAENQPANTGVGGLISNDPDTNDNFVYSLVSGTGDTDNGLFQIDGATLHTRQPFNFEAQNLYSVRIQADDGKGGVFAQAFEIHVVDVNEAPTALTLSTANVLEDLPAGSLVAAVKVSDPDAGDTFKLQLDGGDADYFTVDGLTIVIGPKPLPSAEDKSSYTFTIIVFDSAGNGYKQEVTIKVVNHVELSIPTSLEFSPLWVQNTGQIEVPVNYQSKSNDVTVVNFILDYEQSCLAYKGNVGAADVQDNGDVLDITVKGDKPFGDGKLVVLTFVAQGACGAVTDLSPLNFLKAAASAADAPVYTYDGEIYVIPNDRRGDCNSDQMVDAADFMADVQEIFDDADSAGVDTGFWLLAPRITYHGSPIGCDSNSSTQIDVADILCTVNVVFGDPSCTVAQAAMAGAVTPASLSVTSTAADDDSVLVTVKLAANGNAAAGAAFSLVYDPAHLEIDRTDANQDGIPDAITVDTPADYLRVAQVSYAGDQVDFALVDQTAPLTPLADGTLVTARLHRLDDSTQRVTLVNASLGSTDGTQTPLSVTGAGDPSSSFKLFLPSVTR